MRPMPIILPAALLTATLAAPTDAQYLVGDGRALDANPSTLTRYNPPRFGFLGHRINESIVTGTAPGGTAFRGDVGYTSPWEFRGAAAGRNIYDFERDSWYSGLPHHRPTTASLDAMRRPAQRYPGTGPAQQPVTLTAPGGGVALHHVARARYGTGIPELDVGGTLRQARGRDQPLDVGLPTTASALPRRVAPAEAPITADPLLDRTTPWHWRDRPVSPILPRGPEIHAPTEPAEPIRPEIDWWSQRQWMDRVELRTGAGDPVDLRLRPGEDRYLDILARLAAPEEEELPPDQPYIQEIMERIERMLDELHDPEATPSLQEGEQPSAAPPHDLLERLRTPVEVDRFSGEGEGRFDEQLRKAEEAMSEGRYFDAERWFDVALTVSPNHPMATAGRAHAQLGAGLYRSAATTLRILLRAHPELAAVRYDASLLPSPMRLTEIEKRLAEMLEADDSLRGEAGLLLAYLGHQTQRAELVTHGLQALGRDDPVATMLRAMWGEPGK